MMFGTTFERTPTIYLDIREGREKLKLAILLSFDKK